VISFVQRSESEPSPHKKKRSLTEGKILWRSQNDIFIDLLSPSFTDHKISTLSQSDSEFELVKKETDLTTTTTTTATDGMHKRKRQKISIETTSESSVAFPASTSPKFNETAVRKLITNELDKFRVEIQQILRQQKNEIEVILKNQKTTVEQLLATYKENIKEQIHQVRLCTDTLSVKLDTLSRRLDTEIKSKFVESLLNHYEKMLIELRKETTPQVTK
jgi:ATP-dependent Lon protease